MQGSHLHRAWHVESIGDDYHVVESPLPDDIDALLHVFRCGAGPFFDENALFVPHGFCGVAHGFGLGAVVGAEYVAAGHYEHGVFLAAFCEFYSGVDALHCVDSGLNRGAFVVIGGASRKDQDRGVSVLRRKFCLV